MDADQRRRDARAARSVLALWLPYAVLNAIDPGPVLIYGLGLLWGWQVARGRTVVYAMAQHAVFLAVQ